jgi:hypothetical protein
MFDCISPETIDITKDNLVQFGVNKATIKNGAKAIKIKLLTSYFLLLTSYFRQAVLV